MKRILLIILLLTGCSYKVVHNQIPAGVVQNDYIINNNLVEQYVDNKEMVVTITNSDNTLLKTGFIYTHETIDNRYYVMSTYSDSAISNLQIIAYDNITYTGQYYAGYEQHNMAIYTFIASKTYRVADIVDSSSIQEGELIYMISTSIYKEFNNALTVGTLSASNRVVYSDQFNLYSHQANIPLNYGSFGAPVFNYQGKVVGMMVANYKENEGLSFFIPLTEYQVVIDTLMNQQEYKSVKLGIKGILSSEYFSKFNFAPGYYIAEVVEEGNFANAGIPNDVLMTKISYQEVEYPLTESSDLPRLILKLVTGAEITVTYLLEPNGQEVQKTLTLQ